MQRSTPNSHPLAKDMKCQKNTQSRSDNGRLNSEADVVTGGSTPRLLEVSDGKSTEHSGEVQEAGDFTRSSWVRIQSVGSDSDGGSHDTEDVHSPSHN